MTKRLMSKISGVDRATITRNVRLFLKFYEEYPSALERLLTS